MCFHSKQSKDAQTLKKRFKATSNPELNLTSERFNGFTFPQTPIISNANPEKIQLYNWGLIPHWAKDNTIRANTLNARIETITELPSFKYSVQKRCLVLVDGFYEWQWQDKAGKKKVQYLITDPQDDSFAMAGIWSEWTDQTTGETQYTYSILTTEANQLMAEIHNSKKRMPVILTPQNEQDWLSGKPINDFAKPEVKLKAISLEPTTLSLF